MTRFNRKHNVPRPQRRGDNIPPVSAYSHYNEEAQSMWYAENRYDMEHWDEPLDETDNDYGMPGDVDEDE